MTQKRIADLRRHLGVTLYGRPLQRRPRFGVYGGEFSPIHYGHLLSAQYTRWKKGLDKVLFVPTGTSPNKTGSLPADARYDMCVAATGGNPFFDTSRSDIRAGGTSYMINTVEGVLDEWGGDIDISVMISSEYLNPDHEYWLPKWDGAKEMFAIPGLRFIVFPRDHVELAVVRGWAKLVKGVKIEVVETPEVPLSSTMIREWIQRDRSIWYTTPWKVQHLIAKERHYMKPGQEMHRHEPCAEADVKRIGIYPGMFDPIHYGDLLRGEWARQEHSLDRVLFATSATPPNNRSLTETAEDRHDMVVAATAENPFFRAWRAEVDRHQVSYTLQTVKRAREVYGKDVELFVLLRSEYLNPKHPFTLKDWMGADTLFGMCKFIAFPNGWTDVEQTQRWAKQVPGAEIEVVYAPHQSVTSEEIRGLVADGKPTMYCTPGDVHEIIAKRGLYGYAEAMAVGARGAKRPAPTRR